MNYTLARHAAEVFGVCAGLLAFYFWDKAHTRRIRNEAAHPKSYPPHRYFKARARRPGADYDSYIVCDSCMNIAVSFCCPSDITGDYGRFLFDDGFIVSKISDFDVLEILESSDYLSREEAAEAGEV